MSPFCEEIFHFFLRCYAACLRLFKHFDEFFICVAAWHVIFMEQFKTPFQSLHIVNQR